MTAHNILIVYVCLCHLQGLFHTSIFIRVVYARVFVAASATASSAVALQTLLELRYQYIPHLINRQ